MTRVSAGPATRRRHKKVLKLAKGFRGRASTCFRVAVEKVEKSLQYSYRDRRVRKRQMRSLWIQRINAAARMHGLTYSQLIHNLAERNIHIDRKMLADLAARDAEAFAVIVKSASPSDA